MTIPVTYVESTAAYAPLFGDGGFYYEPDGTLRLHYYPHFKEVA